MYIQFILVLYLQHSTQCFSIPLYYYSSHCGALLRTSAPPFQCQYHPSRQWQCHFQYYTKLPLTNVLLNSAAVFWLSKWRDSWTCSKKSPVKGTSRAKRFCADDCFIFSWLLCFSSTPFGNPCDYKFQNSTSLNFMILDGCPSIQFYSCGREPRFHFVKYSICRCTATAQSGCSYFTLG